MDWQKKLSSSTLDAHPRADAIKRIIAAALDAADPADALRQELALTSGLLRCAGRVYPLKEISALYLISVGKAAVPMAEAAAEIVGTALSGGVVVYKAAAPHPETYRVPELTYLPASHPLPDQRSLAAGEKILALLENSRADDLVIFLISGGGSALITAPQAPLSLADISELTALLLGCGARIDEINTLRRALDRVKGGGLARAAAPAQSISLLLSDVVNSPLAAIASGPTVPNPTSNADALAILQKYSLLDKVPLPVKAFLAKEITPPALAQQQMPVKIIGSNAISAEAARAQAVQEGFFAKVVSTALQGEAAQVGRDLAKTLTETVLRQDQSRPFCLIFGGETTVTLGSAQGVGGRNQEVALAAVEVLAGQPDLLLITFASDGDDGPTDAAGAVVNGATFVRARALGLDVAETLRQHNAYPFFDSLADLLKPGMTGTNVNDLTFLFAF